MSIDDGFAGRALLLTWSGSAIGGAREKSITIGGEPIDVTDDGSSGWRKLLNDDGMRTVDISLSGVTKSNVLKAAKFAGGTSTVAAIVVTYPTGGGSFTGDFKLVSYTETGTYNDAVTFDAEFQSTGAVTYTPPA